MTAPVTAGGNAVSVIGDATSTGSDTSAPSTGGSTSQPGTSGDDSTGGGNQVDLPVAAPVTIGGNAVSVVGDATTEGSTTPSDPTTPTEPTDPGTPGEPTDPGTPGEPTDPGTPGEPTDPGVPTEPGNPADPGDTGDRGDDQGASRSNGPTRTSITTVAADGSMGELAQTGADVTVLVGSALALLLLGGLLSGASRRRLAEVAQG
ncbi:hypothetical protein GCM10011314_00010 [Knoellia flava]|uniref:Chaplin domain-containing protein n=1 Tax=Knoellia flava TaxID=913969 RepID=A0A8H9FS04_9MICO|nr:hypothetical protein GCM10011314_00010 [Knoellia flava]